MKTSNFENNEALLIEPSVWNDERGYFLKAGIRKILISALEGKSTLRKTTNHIQKKEF